MDKIEYKLILDNDQVEFLISRTLEHKQKMWNNGNPLPGYDFANDLLKRFIKQARQCLPGTYNE